MSSLIASQGDISKYFLVDSTNKDRYISEYYQSNNTVYVDIDHYRYLPMSFLINKRICLVIDNTSTVSNNLEEYYSRKINKIIYPVDIVGREFKTYMEEKKPYFRKYSAIYLAINQIFFGCDTSFYGDSMFNTRIIQTFSEIKIKKSGETHIFYLKPGLILDSEGNILLSICLDNSFAKEISKLDIGEFHSLKRNLQLEYTNKYIFNKFGKLFINNRRLENLPHMSNVVKHIFKFINDNNYDFDIIHTSNIENYMFETQVSNNRNDSMYSPSELENRFYKNTEEREQFLENLVQSVIQ